MSQYYIGVAKDVRGASLKHYKYTHKDRKNGKWVYYYNDSNSTMKSNMAKRLAEADQRRAEEAAKKAEEEAKNPPKKENPGKTPLEKYGKAPDDFDPGLKHRGGKLYQGKDGKYYKGDPESIKQLLWEQQQEAAEQKKKADEEAAKLAEEEKKADEEAAKLAEEEEKKKAEEEEKKKIWGESGGLTTQKKTGGGRTAGKNDRWYLTNSRPKKPKRRW